MPGGSRRRLLPALDRRRRCARLRDRGAVADFHPREDPGPRPGLDVGVHRPHRERNDRIARRAGLRQRRHRRGGVPRRGHVVAVVGAVREAAPQRHLGHGLRIHDRHRGRGHGPSAADAAVAPRGVARVPGHRVPGDVPRRAGGLRRWRAGEDGRPGRRAPRHDGAPAPAAGRRPRRRHGRPGRGRVLLGARARLAVRRRVLAGHAGRRCELSTGQVIRHGQPGPQGDKRSQ